MPMIPEPFFGTVNNRKQLSKKRQKTGLAQDFCNRTLDHFKALSITKDGETTISVNQSGEIVEVEVNENINLLKETERNFLHIPIFEYVHRQYDLKDIETAFMSIVKEAGFELYNTAKINYSYPTELEPIRNELCSSLNKSLQALDLNDIDALGALETAVITVTMENASDIRIALDYKMVHNCLYLSPKEPYAYYTFVQI